MKKKVADKAKKHFFYKWLVTLIFCQSVICDDDIHFAWAY